MSAKNRGESRRGEDGVVLKFGVDVSSVFFGKLIRPILASAERQHLTEAAAGVEVFLREHPRRAAVALVMRINLRDTGDSLFRIAKHQQTFSRGQVMGKPAVPGKNGSAAREISGATVAQPTGL